MKLKKLLKGLEGVEVRGSKEVEVSGLSIDSRVTAPGHLFIAKKGTKLSGADFIQQAILSGAAAVLTDFYDPFLKKPQIIHSNPAELEAPLASRFYERPSRELFIVGSTGTKGKTTTTYIAKHLLDCLTIPSGLLSTVETVVQEIRFPSKLTTHDPIYNQKILREMVSRGCKGAAIEVSSHGLAQKRVDEIEFDAAIFTHLTPDHLDYHPTIDDYAAAKKRLFQLLDISPKKKRRAFFNADSSWTSFMREGIQTPSWTFGIDQPADVRAVDLSFGPERTCFTVEFAAMAHRFETSLIGRFNIYNLLGPIALGLHLGASLEELALAVKSFQSAPGRLDRVGKNVFIDYAHTGDALENVLKTLKESSQGRLIVVFGAGGDRDPRRRIEMAVAADRWADVSIVTTDNPRSEDPEAIAREIFSGFINKSKAFIELDRKAAIHRAIREAAPQDVVLIAGKGHEKGQIFGTQTIPFDDAAVAKEVL